ncbi:MAG: serine hydrolase [Actinomycetes bacterium]
MSTGGARFEVHLPHEVSWSVRVGPADGSDTLFDHQPDAVCATASVGKILLLIAVAERLADGQLDATHPVSRQGVEPVADSGLWQHLRLDELSVVDACCMIGATSDNLATNILIDLVGLDAVARTTEQLGLSEVSLDDIVRDVRRPEHPVALSTGNGRDLYRLCCELSRPQTLSPAVTNTVIGWLALNTDLSMVAGSFGLDPLAHVEPDRGVVLWNKTGTNVGVRCDVGVVSRGHRRLAYAVLANWTPAGERDELRDQVLQAMRAIGKAANEWLLEA